VLQAEAAQLLEDLARLDLIEVVGSRPDTLSVSQLRRLTVQRQRNAIRHWLIGLKLAVPARRQLEHVLTDAINARWDSTAVVTWPGGEIRRYRDDLYAMKPRPEHDPTVRMRWDGCGPLHIPSLNISLDPFMLRALGLATEVVRSQVTVRFRRGGERCRPAGRRHNRELKKLFQEAGVPPWERDRIPLVYVRESLAIVVGHWTCEV
jgi:tRNA(Ile)-lysidine synthase